MSDQSQTRKRKTPSQSTSDGQPIIEPSKHLEKKNKKLPTTIPSFTFVNETESLLTSNNGRVKGGTPLCGTPLCGTPLLLLLSVDVQTCIFQFSSYRDIVSVSKTCKQMRILFLCKKYKVMNKITYAWLKSVFQSMSWFISDPFSYLPICTICKCECKQQVAPSALDNKRYIGKCCIYPFRSAKPGPIVNDDGEVIPIDCKKMTLLRNRLYAVEHDILAYVISEQRSEKSNDVMETLSLDTESIQHSRKIYESAIQNISKTLTKRAIDTALFNLHLDIMTDWWRQCIDKRGVVAISLGDKNAKKEKELRNFIDEEGEKLVVLKNIPFATLQSFTGLMLTLKNCQVLRLRVVDFDIINLDIDETRRVAERFEERKLDMNLIDSVFWTPLANDNVVMEYLQVKASGFMALTGIDSYQTSLIKYLSKSTKHLRRLKITLPDNPIPLFEYLISSICKNSLLRECHWWRPVKTMGIGNMLSNCGMKKIPDAYDPAYNECIETKTKIATGSNFNQCLKIFINGQGWCKPYELPLSPEQLMSLVDTGYIGTRADIFQAYLKVLIHTSVEVHHLPALCVIFISLFFLIYNMF